MRHLGRSALLVAVACVLAATGCSSSADSPSQAPVKNDPAFAADKLRAIDPCGLLDHDTLHPQGTPEDSSSETFVGTPSGLDNCTVDMQTFHHSDLSVGVMVGAETATVGTRHVISGMAVREQENSGDCDELILTPDPTIGIMVQIRTRYSACVTARQITTAMINHIRTNPPRRQVPAGSLSTLDACATADGPTVAAAIGPTSTQVRKTLYDCEWHGGPLVLSVAFWVGDARFANYGEATPQPIDLGGVTGYQVLPDEQSCQIGWNVRPTGSPHQFELVYVEVENLGQAPVDTCAKTVPAARAVLTKLPR
jgi:hypothetical protein